MIKVVFVTDHCELNILHIFVCSFVSFFYAITKKNIYKQSSCELVIVSKYSSSSIRAKKKVFVIQIGKILGNFISKQTSCLPTYLLKPLCFMEYVHILDKE